MAAWTARGRVDAPAPADPDGRPVVGALVAGEHRHHGTAARELLTRVAADLHA